MNCSDIKLLLHAYVDGELDLVRSLDVEKHVQVCPQCAATDKSLRSLRAVLRSAPLNFPASASLRKKLRSLASETENQHRTARSVLLWQWLALGASVSAMVLFLLRPIGSDDRDLLAKEMVSNHVRALMPGHLTDVISSDQHTVKPWFSGKLDFSPDVKDFAAEGFPLVGGRLDYLGGRNVSALVYQHGKHYINVFVWPFNPSADHGLSTSDRQGYHLVYRQINGLNYVLVSDLNSIELNQLANLIGK